MGERDAANPIGAEQAEVRRAPVAWGFASGEVAARLHAVRWETEDSGAWQGPPGALHPSHLQPRPVNDVRRSMCTGAVHRLMACNYRGVIKELVSLLIGKAPAVQIHPANGWGQESACDGVVPTPFPLSNSRHSLLPAPILG